MKRNSVSTGKRGGAAAKPRKSPSTDKMADVDKTVAGRVYILLDESGSMNRERPAYLAAVNDYINGLKRETPNALITLVQFDTRGFRIQYKDCTPVNCSPRNYDNFSPLGGTPLYDSVAELIALAKPAPHVIPPMLVIITDGKENESKEITDVATIVKMISALQNEGWAFVFLAQGLDAYGEGSKMNIDRTNSMLYTEQTLGEVIGDRLVQATRRYIQSAGAANRNLMTSTK